MRFNRYLAVMAGGWLLAAAGVIGFTLLVDAIGISPLRISIAGLNTSKPLRQDYDWISKRFDVWRNQPATVFMGSSRVKQSIDPKLLSETAFAPAYNAGLNGSANFAETNTYLHYYLQSDRNLRRVLIEAFVPALFDSETAPLVVPTENTKRPTVLQLGLASDIADLTSVFFSLDGVRSAIRTVAANWSQSKSPVIASVDDGFAPIALAPHHFSVRNVFNFVLHTGVVRRGEQVSLPVLAAAKQMIAYCESYRVECRFFVSPLHADVLYAMYYLGLWPELEKLKRELAHLTPTYDFTRYSRLIEERIGPVVYWPEAFHFSPALGELMAKVMTGSRTADIPENFGALLGASNIETSLAAWSKERDLWIAQHPEIVERMQKAADDFRNGLSFQSVTDAEIRAGGW